MFVSLATQFMTYHTVLKTSADYIEALRYSRELADNITNTVLRWHNQTHPSVDAGDMPFTNITEKVFPYRSDLFSQTFIK